LATLLGAEYTSTRRPERLDPTHRSPRAPSPKETPMQRTNELVPRCLPTLWLAALAALGAGCSTHEHETARAEPEPRSAAPKAADPKPAEPAQTATAGAETAKKASAARFMLPCPSVVPEGIDPPANATLDVAFMATGVQIYACSAAKAGDAPAWVLDGPHAVLNAGRDVAGIHFAGPIWQALDGSSIKGAKLASADAPKDGAVPWLLLSATPSGFGTFEKVTHVQRLDTEGGKAPSEGCDAQHLGAKVLVPYRSNYFFYRTAPEGQTVHQCRSTAGAAKHKP
jgi:hypothetical protein